MDKHGPQINRYTCKKTSTTDKLINLGYGKMDRSRKNRWKIDGKKNGKIDTDFS